jgi:lipid II:glycine glycyltransferase (peptidoglycan interpeptide bridge formation enzyme)
MVNIRLATEEDKEGWNKVAYESLEATYAHTWEWKEVIEEGLGLESICLVAEDKGEIIGIYPAFLGPKFEFSKPRKLTYKLTNKFQVLWSPLTITWDYGGPCAILDTNKEILKNLVIAMEKQAKKSYVTDIRVSPFYNSSHLIAILSVNGYRTSPRLTSIIDLTKSEGELWHGVKKNARRYINKPQRAGVTVSEQTNEIGLKNFYMCIEELKKDSLDPIYIPPYSFYKIMLDTLKPPKMVKIHNVIYNGEVIGGSISIYFKDIVTFRYAKVIGKYQDLHPHYLLHWVRIKESKDLGYKYIDLGGIPSDTNSGIYFFKTRWGGEIKNVDWYIKDVAFKKFRNARRKIIRGGLLGGYSNRTIKQ